MKLKFFIYLGLLLISGQAFADKFCTTKPDDVEISLGDIVISPGAAVGDVVKSSEMIKKTTKCAGASYPLVAYTSTAGNIPTGVYVDFPKEPSGGAYSKNCEAMESGFPGLGIAWVNFNSSTNKWQCASINPANRVTRGLPQDGENIIYDQIILVKTGPIGNGSGQNENFMFNKTFQFNERHDSPSGYLPDNGLLYKLTLVGETVIQAPICEASSSSDSFEFSTKDAVGQEYTSTPSQVIDIHCKGVIENGTVANFKPISSNGVFSQDNNYFATSEPGLGVSVKYSANEDITSNIITPESYIEVPITNNKGVVKLNYTPYIKGDSSSYPLIENITFSLKLSNGQNN